LRMGASVQKFVRGDSEPRLMDPSELLPPAF
jgi:hypothetical protein